MIAALRQRRVEALCEALALGLFMLSASVFAVLLEGSASPVRAAIADPFTRRALMGLAMGATAVLLITSPFGRRSGAHMNPAVTWTFLRLGKVRPADAAVYTGAQVAGGMAGMAIAGLALGPRLEEVGWVATLPGAEGVGVAFTAEALISFLLMSTVLVLSNAPSLAHLTPWAAGALVAAFITFEAPLSGMSINPARTLASAFFAGRWDAFWVYLLAPPLGMLLAAELFVRARGLSSVLCAKLDHRGDHPCPFFCRMHG